MQMPARGFTLIELLVTLLVIVLLTAVAGLSVGGGREAREHAAALALLADLVAYAQDEAELSGRDIGLLLELARDGTPPRFAYRWLERRPEGWRPPRQEREVFSERLLPPALELQLEVEGVATAVREPASGVAALGVVPQLIFYASGEVTPARLEVRDRRDGALVDALTWDLVGRLLRETPAG